MNQKGYELCERLVGLFHDQLLGLPAAQGFEIVMGDTEDGVLTKLSFATIKV